MSKTIIQFVPLAGTVLAVTVLAFAAYNYAGDVEWARVTVSLLCAPTLPDGTPNPVRAASVAGLVVLCFSLGLLFQLISQRAEHRRTQKTIQIAGIGSMVYALLTATPMHNLMVNIALLFFIVALATIIYELYRNQNRLLATLGIACILLKLGSLSLYYSNSLTEFWGIVQKLSFAATTLWLFSVHLGWKRADTPKTTGPTQRQQPAL